MLKNVLSLLLSKFYSKQESELVGHQAMPSSQSISITPTVNSVGDEVATVATFNAQADGFVIVRATTDGAPPSRLILSSYVSTYIFNNSAGGTIATFIPIAKGIQCTVQGRNLKNIAISLYKTIGGVQALKNALLQGGGLCLNSLSSSLRRSSWLENRNGLQVGGISQSAVKLLSRSQTAWTFKHTRLQQTVSYLSDKTLRATDTLKSMLVAHGLTLTKAKQRLTTKGFVFRLSREARSPLRRMEKTEEITLSWNFHRLLANRNPAVGGASC